jgi:hypothetical protein
VQPSSGNDWNQSIQQAHLLDHFILSFRRFALDTATRALVGGLGREGCLGLQIVFK